LKSMAGGEEGGGRRTRRRMRIQATSAVLLCGYGTSVKVLRTDLDLAFSARDEQARCRHVGRSGQ
jgi:hypothetical protein